jgi:N utilization substance protein A
MVVSELRGEKIDIIPYNEEPARFVAKALSPARVREVLVDDEGRQATVVVPDDQLSLAIGREGQNARLAARLTGWRVDIRSETEFAAEEAEHGYEEEEQGGRCAAIMANGRRCPNAALPGSRYCGLELHQALEGIEGDDVRALTGGAPAAEPAAAGPAPQAEAPERAAGPGEEIAAGETAPPPSPDELPEPSSAPSGDAPASPLAAEAPAETAEERVPSDVEPGDAGGVQAQPAADRQPAGGDPSAA